VSQEEDEKDKCHFNIKDVPRNEGDRLIKNVKIEEVTICADGGPRRMTQDDVGQLLQA